MALLVGGVGVANVMVVLERRGEIGIRRALVSSPGSTAGGPRRPAVPTEAFAG